MAYEITKDERQWRDDLTPEQYRVLRKSGTERAFTGAFYDNHDDGVYRCAACHAALFSSDAKFDSGTGWPSFFEPAVAEAVELHRDFGILACAPRCAAGAAGPTSATSSTTGRARPASGFASTRPHSSSSPWARRSW